MIEVMITMLTLILDSTTLKYRRVLALSKLSLGWAGTRNPFDTVENLGGTQGDIGTESAERQGSLLDMCNHQQRRY